MSLLVLCFAIPFEASIMNAPLDCQVAEFFILEGFVQLLSAK